MITPKQEMEKAMQAAWNKVVRHWNVYDQQLFESGFNAGCSFSEVKISLLKSKLKRASKIIGRLYQSIIKMAQDEGHNS